MGSKPPFATKGTGVRLGPVPAVQSRWFVLHSVASIIALWRSTASKATNATSVHFDAIVLLLHIILVSR